MALIFFLLQGFLSQLMWHKSGTHLTEVMNLIHEMKLTTQRFGEGGMKGVRVAECKPSSDPEAAIKTLCE